MKPNPITASRIKQLRIKKKLTQNEFCVSFSEFSGRDTVIYAMTLSNWETGKKIPPTETIIWLARYFGVSTDYILGLSDDEGNSPEADSSSKKPFATIAIPYNELSKHDGEPVYVEFPDGMYQNQYALLDYAGKTLIMTQFKMKLNERCKYFVTIPPEELTVRNRINHLLRLEDVVKMERVYIESLSPDPYIKGQVDGWYKNDVSGKFLINELGRTLSYEGLGISYNAIDFKAPQKVIK